VSIHNFCGALSFTLVAVSCLSVVYPRKDLVPEQRWSSFNSDDNVSVWGYRIEHFPIRPFESYVFGSGASKLASLSAALADQSLVKSSRTALNYCSEIHRGLLILIYYSKDEST
jgi:hypothetical protein